MPSESPHGPSGPEFEARPAEGLNYPNVVQMFRARVLRSPHAPALRFKRDRAWQTLTWRQWWDRAQELAAGLVRTAQVRPETTVAVLAPTRIEWILLDLAIPMAGGISVPIYPSLTADHIRFILDDAGCRVVVVDREDRLRPEDRHGRTIVVLDPQRTDDPASVSWAALERDGRAGQAELRPLLERRADELRLDDAFTYVYTSGTTGTPKGVVLTHRNFVYEAWAIKNVVPVDEHDEQLLVLPLAHIFARHLLWGAVEQGAVTAIGDGEAQLAKNLIEVAPTFMGAVPRVYERMHARVHHEIVGHNRITRRAFGLALDVGRRVSTLVQRGSAVPTSLALRAAVAENAFFGRIKAMFGGRLRFLVSGGAATSQEIAEFFHACGVLVLEGYGLTETTGATNVNRPDRFRFGTVGPAMPGCELRIADDGEILVRGHNVMARYLNLPEETRAAFDAQGWFRTGDVGELRDGFLRITDRKKDLFKISSGKYVAPRLIEGRLAAREGIAYAVVFGEGRPCAAALVALDKESLMRLSEREGLGCRTYADLAVHPRIRKLVQQHVDDVNATLAPFEAVRRFHVVRQPFSEETGELTPMRRVRRREVLQKYDALVAELFADEPRPGLTDVGRS